MYAQALETSTKRLEKLRASGEISKFALIGGLAVARWGYPRSTGDIDFAISPGSLSLEALARALKGKARHGDAADPLAGSVTFHVRARRSSIPVQLLVFYPSWEQLIFEVKSRATFNRVSIPVIHWRALVLLKLYAGAASDVEDAQKILEAQAPDADDLAALKTRATKLRVSKKLDRLLASVSTR